MIQTYDIHETILKDFLNFENFTWLMDGPTDPPTNGQSKMSVIHLWITKFNYYFSTNCFAEHKIKVHTIETNRNWPPYIKYSVFFICASSYSREDRPAVHEAQKSEDPTSWSRVFPSVAFYWLGWVSALLKRMALTIDTSELGILVGEWHAIAAHRRKEEKWWEALSVEN